MELFWLWFFIIFLSLKDKTYLVYGFLGLSLLLYQLSRQGILYELFSNILDLYLIGLFAWIFGSLSITFIFLFAIMFFDTSHKSPKLHKLLIFISSILAIFTILFIYSYFDVNFLLIIRPIFTPLTILSLLIPLFIGIYAYVKEFNGAIYYLIGHGIYILTLFYQQLNTVYGGEINLISTYASSFGVIVEIAFLSLAPSDKIKALKIDKRCN